MDELLYRQMPHSLEAEQAVLGSMLIDCARTGRSSRRSIPCSSTPSPSTA